MSNKINNLVQLLKHSFQEDQIQVRASTIFIKIGNGIAIQLAVLEEEVLVSTSSAIWGRFVETRKTMSSAFTDIEAVLLASNLRYSILRQIGSFG